MFYIIQNSRTEQIWRPDGCDGVYGFPSLTEASNALRNLEPGCWELKKAVPYGMDVNESPTSLVKTFTKPIYQPPEGSIASKIKVRHGEHILICGEVQIGKLKEKHELIVCFRELHNVPMLALFRNNNVDYHQFTKRLDEFNAGQRQSGRPTIPQPFDILSHQDRLAELLKEPNVILGLANPDTFAIVERCMNDHPELRGKLVVIVDEADLVTFELEGKDLRTKTEEHLLSLFDKIYMLISVTGTGGSILLCDKESQVYVIDRPDNYYGIDRIKHIPVQPVRAKKKHQQYNPELDRDNLYLIMEDILGLPTATLLILVSRLRREHKNVISYLSSEYVHLGSDIVYLELNEKSVKVYNHDGRLIDNIARKTFKGTKVGPIDVAIQKFIGVKYVVIVAGVLAGRGVSFVSEDYSRHLTHQYIADPDGTHLESAMQSVRLLGKYNDDPTLTLYCSESLYGDLLSQCWDMKTIIDLAIEARENKGNMPDLIAAQKEYTHKWFSPRKQKGISFEMKKSRAYTLEIEDYSEELRQAFWFDSILTNRDRDYPAMLLRQRWPSGGAGDGKKRKEYVVYCNPLSDFTLDGIRSYKERYDIKAQVYDELLAKGYRHMASLVELYERCPHYEGKVIRRVETKTAAKVDTFSRRKRLAENQNGQYDKVTTA